MSKKYYAYGYGEKYISFKEHESDEVKYISLKNDSSFEKINLSLRGNKHISTCKVNTYEDLFIYFKTALERLNHDDMVYIIENFDLMSSNNQESIVVSLVNLVNRLESEKVNEEASKIINNINNFTK